MQQRFLLPILLLAQHVSGSILQAGRITLSSTPDQLLEKPQHKIPQAATLYNTLELLMMGMVMPETC